jgi:hypothetical protein
MKEVIEKIQRMLLTESDPIAKDFLESTLLNAYETFNTKER